MRTTRDTLLGEAAEECGVPGGGPVVALRGQGSGLGAQRVQSADDCPAREAIRACGRREGVGVTRHKLHSASEYPVSGRIRTRSVQPSAIRSAQGRA